MGLFMARTLFGTSLLALGSTALREKRARFANDEMCRITEALIFQVLHLGSSYHTTLLFFVRDAIHGTVSFQNDVQPL